MDELTPESQFMVSQLCRECIRAGVKHKVQDHDPLRCERCGKLLTRQDDWFRWGNRTESGSDGASEP